MDNEHTLPDADSEVPAEEPTVLDDGEGEIVGDGDDTDDAEDEDDNLDGDEDEGD